MRSRQVLLVLLAMLLLGACGGDDDEPLPTVTQVPPRPTLSSSVPTPAGTPVIQRTLPPTLAPSPSPTLPYPVTLYAGQWVLNLRYKITDFGGPDASIDEWIYAGSVTLNVSEAGIVSGSGVIWPTPDDEQCIVRSLDYESGLPFLVEGALRYDRQEVWFDVTLDPGVNFDFEESYGVLCANDTNGERIVTSNYFWPMLSQIEALSYTFSTETGQDTIVLDVDLAERTLSALRGQLHAELILRR